MQDKPFVSVIIITRNRPQYLKECLQHLKRQSYTNFETVVVDSSDNQESRRVIDEHPDIKYIRFYNGKNMAISRNLGITDSKGAIVSFVDDDCLIEEDWLKEMVRSFIDEKIGEVGGRIIDEHSSLYTQEVSKIGRIYPNGILSGFHDYDGEKPFFVDYLAGNMSFRKDVLTELGGFDPIFRVWNDVDICMRVKKAGYSIVFNPRMKLYHKIAKREFISRDRSNFISQYIYNRSHSCCLFKNKGFKYAYFKTLFYWKYIGILKNNRHSSLVKMISLIFGQLLGSITGLILAIKSKVCGKKNFLELSKIEKYRSRLNVVHLCHYSTLFGGGAQDMFNICKFMNREVVNNICLFVNDGQLVKKFKEIGIKCKIIRLGLINKLNMLPFIKTLLNGSIFFIRNRVNILHLHTQVWKDPFVLAAKVLGVKIIAHFHSPQEVDVFWLCWADQFIFNSQSTRRLTDPANRYFNKSKVLYYGIDLEQFDKEKEDMLRKEYKIPSDFSIVGIIGKVEPVKGTEYFIRMAKEILKVRKEVVFTVVGGPDDTDLDGHYMAKMKALVKELNIEENVIFTGWRRDIEKIYGSLDILVVPSLHEPVSWVIIEGLVCYKPIVASNVDGIPEAVEDRVSGILVKPGDYVAMAKEVLNLLRHKDLAKNLATAGRKKAEKQFDLKRHIEDVEGIYLELNRRGL